MNAPVDRTTRPDDLIVANVSRRRFLLGISVGGLVLAVGYPSVGFGVRLSSAAADMI